MAKICIIICVRSRSDDRDEMMFSLHMDMWRDLDTAMKI